MEEERYAKAASRTEEAEASSMAWRPIGDSYLACEEVYTDIWDCTESLARSAISGTGASQSESPVLEYMRYVVLQTYSIMMLVQLCRMAFFMLCYAYATSSNSGVAIHVSWCL